jgi:glycerol uptake facilitator-like aquaporin
MALVNTWKAESLVVAGGGGTVKWGQPPIYVLAEFVGAVAAGFLYSVIVSVRTTNRAVAPK